MSEDPRRAHARARAHARTRQRRPSGPSPMPPMPERVGMRQMPTNVSTAAWDAERARFFADYGARIYGPNLIEDTNLNIVDIAEKWHTSYSKITDILVRGASARGVTFTGTNRFLSFAAGNTFLRRLFWSGLRPIEIKCA